jgi:hypothetical protein
VARRKAWWWIVGGTIGAALLTGIFTGLGGDVYSAIKNRLSDPQARENRSAATSASTMCTVAGRAVDMYSRQPLDKLNVVVFKPNTCGIAVVNTYTEADGHFSWRSSCTEISGQPIQVSLGAGNYCSMKTGWFVNKDVESPFLLAVDSAMLSTPGGCRPCPMRQAR